GAEPRRAAIDPANPRGGRVYFLHTHIQAPQCHAATANSACPLKPLPSRPLERLSGRPFRSAFATIIYLRHLGDMVAMGSSRASSAPATDDQCSISGDCATSRSLSVPDSCRLSQCLILQAERQCLFPFS